MFKLKHKSGVLLIVLASSATALAKPSEETGKFGIGRERDPLAIDIPDRGGPGSLPRSDWGDRAIQAVGEVADSIVESTCVEYCSGIGAAIGYSRGGPVGGVHGGGAGAAIGAVICPDRPVVGGGRGRNDP